MGVRFPKIEKKLGLGVGLDMAWGSPFGFSGNAPTEKVARFLKRHSEEFNYSFLSWQPRNRDQLNAAEYFEPFNAFLKQAPTRGARALHHTLLNAGTTDPGYRRAEIIDFTNELIDQHGFDWVNEDLGIWSIRGKSLPYPLPPLLTAEGLDACIRNVREYQRGLSVPFLVEFPGFSDGTNFFVGKLDAYDYLRRIAEETDSPVTLDTGHLLSWRWMNGHRGAALYADLERLPLSHCFEIHLSGCQISGGRFMDFHHGVLMDEQLSLLDHLLELCPNVKAVTFEDPKFQEDGELIAKSRPGFERLKERVVRWSA